MCTALVQTCEYCGRGLPLVIDKQWCSELCKYAQRVYDEGEYVVNLFNGRLCKRVRNGSIEHRKIFPKAFLLSINVSKQIILSNKRQKGKIRSEEVKEKLKGKKHSEEWCNNIAESHKGEKFSKERCQHISKALKGKKPSEKTLEAQRIAKTGRKLSKEHRKNLSVVRTQLVANGTHNWPKEKPVNNPTERIFDFFFAFIFLMNWNHNFKSLTEKCREFELDFVSWLLRFNVEANEPYHDDEKDKIRDEFIVDSGDLDFVHRYSTEYAITNMIDVIKTVYAYCNQQREKHKFLDLPILEFDTRWNLYCFQMQDLLREWHEKKSGSQRFKTFRDKKREIDKQWLRLLEETSQKYSTNFADIYREILEKNLKLSFKNVVSPWRMKEKK